jgi:hypothetical protein
MRQVPVCYGSTKVVSVPFGQSSRSRDKLSSLRSKSAGQRLTREAYTKQRFELFKAVRVLFKTSCDHN